MSSFTMALTKSQNCGIPSQIQQALKCSVLTVARVYDDFDRNKEPRRDIECKSLEGYESQGSLEGYALIGYFLIGLIQL